MKCENDPWESLSDKMGKVGVDCKRDEKVNKVNSQGDMRDIQRNYKGLETTMNERLEVQ